MSTPTLKLPLKVSRLTTFSLKPPSQTSARTRAPTTPPAAQAVATLLRFSARGISSMKTLHQLVLTRTLRHLQLLTTCLIRSVKIHPSTSLLKSPNKQYLLPLVLCTPNLVTSLTKRASEEFGRCLKPSFPLKSKCPHNPKLSSPNRRRTVWNRILLLTMSSSPPKRRTFSQDWTTIASIKRAAGCCSK